jgi:hypothetical protein
MIFEAFRRFFFPVLPPVVTNFRLESVEYNVDAGGNNRVTIKWDNPQKLVLEAYLGHKLVPDAVNGIVTIARPGKLQTVCVITVGEEGKSSTTYSFYVPETVEQRKIRLEEELLEAQTRYYRDNSYQPPGKMSWGDA